MGYRSDEDEEVMTLSSNALDALKEFYSERDALKAKFEDLKLDAEKRHDEVKQLSIHDFVEDWQESQFWYSDETANLLANHLLEGTTSESTIVAVSAPSVFVALKNALASRDDDDPQPKLVLLDYDKRFSVFPEFVFYDCNSPVELPAYLRGTADRIACDPPFLNEDCQTKEALTVRWLCKPPLAAPAPTDSDDLKDDGAVSSPRIVLCTGERVETLITTKLYKSLGVRTTTFIPSHANKLSNEFHCYANFECEDWTWEKPRE